MFELVTLKEFLVDVINVKYCDKFSLCFYFLLGALRETTSINSILLYVNDKTVKA